MYISNVATVPIGVNKIKAGSMSNEAAKTAFWKGVQGGIWFCGFFFLLLETGWDIFTKSIG